MNENGDYPLTTYKETRIGRTVYQVTCVYLGKTDFQEALEELAVRKVLDVLQSQENIDTVRQEET